MSKKMRKFTQLNALKGRIREVGTTYYEVAGELGIAVNTFSNKINGFSVFSLLEVIRIATILDIDPGDIAHYFMPIYDVNCKIAI
ncbi:DUF739 family protein [Desulfoscipio sp. XC116]|uniref:DUF739 family protein n=1 Tax=Desulfoscipio sp. XC116 TaxID=3144975 RepID=UPI00325BC049